MASTVHISPDIFNTSCRGMSKTVLSSDNASSDISDIEKLSFILLNQNASESRHEPCDGTDDLAMHIH